MNYASRSKGIRYSGGKGKAGSMIRTIQSLIEPGMIYWEPFVGSGKIIQYIKGCHRYGSDIDAPIITLLQAIQAGWNPPNKVSEKEYRQLMSQRREEFVTPMMAFAGYGCSFGARYFQGYARSKKSTVNFAASARQALLRQKPLIQDVIFRIIDYRDLYWGGSGPPDILYCDPPYDNTKACGSDQTRFDSKEFWKWAIKQAKHSIVLVSEYSCPIPNAQIIWEEKIAAGIRFGTCGHGGHKGSGKRKRERLYCLNPKIGNSIGLGVL